MVAAIAGISQVLNSAEGEDPFLAGARRATDGRVAKPDLGLVDSNLGGVIQTTQLAIGGWRGLRAVCKGRSAAEAAP